MARPQSGLQEADAVIEIIVEGGITRFIALFHQSDSGYVGPVRSVRPTDSAMLAPLDPVLLISGGQAWIQALANSRGIPLIGEGSAGLFRMSHRSAPHNLYADTWDARRTADDAGLRRRHQRPPLRHRGMGQAGGAGHHHHPRLGGRATWSPGSTTGAATGGPRTA